jgi:REP element-mobilizing transposase RayT
MKATTSRLPERKHLSHEIPPWVAQGARHFITINCKDRNGASIVQKAFADRLLKSAQFYECDGKWYLWLMLLMPDHIHMIATLDLSRGLGNVVSAWKGYQKKTLGIDWQSGYFEHRLRNEQEFLEKALYIRMNPVRRGLVEHAQDWPHVLDRMCIQGRAKPLSREAGSE